jgi:hypothetical protein
LEAKVAEMSAKEKKEEKGAAKAGGAPKATKPAHGAPAGKVK